MNDTIQVHAVEAISAGTLEKRKIVADNSLMADVKAIRIISRRKKNVGTHVDHKLLKKSAPSPKLKVRVWGRFRAGISITVMVFAKNSFIVDVRETKTDS